MSHAIYVLFARKAQRAGRRDHLKYQPYEGVRWLERRRMLGSEFFLTRPNRETREVHQTAALWLSRADGPF